MHTPTVSGLFTLEELAPWLHTATIEEVERRLGRRFLVTSWMCASPEPSRAVDMRATLPGYDKETGHERPPQGRVGYLVQPLALEGKPWGQLIVGRDASADIYLEDRSVSRRHAILAWCSGEIVVTDLYSRNGTYVDGKKIEPGSDGSISVVRLGAQLLFGVAECALFDAQRLADLGAIITGGARSRFREPAL